jgi:hypothetical protein
MPSPMDLTDSLDRTVETRRIEASMETMMMQDRVGGGIMAPSDGAQPDTEPTSKTENSTKLPLSPDPIPDDVLDEITELLVDWDGVSELRFSSRVQDLFQKDEQFAQTLVAFFGLTNEGRTKPVIEPLRQED